MDENKIVLCGANAYEKKYYFNEEQFKMIPEELGDMKFDKRLGRKIVKFLKQNDPKMIFIYGQNDPWTAAGVTWLKGKKNIHVFVQPGGSHLARISTLPEAMRVRVIAQIHGYSFSLSAR